MRRLALPFALSLVVHAVMVALLWQLPAHVAPPAPSGSGRSLAVDLCIRGPERPRTVPKRKIDDWDVDVEPARLLAATPSPSPTVVVPMPSPGGGGLGASGTAAGPAVASAPPGSTILPVPICTQKIVYILDRSATMGLHDALDRARAELALSLKALPPATLFQVFTYNRFVSALLPAQPGLALADPSRIALAAGALEDVAAAGSTDHAGALRRGLALRPDLLYLLTDVDYLSDIDVQAITRSNAGGAAIHVVEFTRDLGLRTDSPLTRLATANGGTHRRVALGR